MSKPNLQTFKEKKVGHYKCRLLNILDMYADGETFTQIGKKLNITRQRVEQIIYKLKAQGAPIPLKNAMKKQVREQIIKEYDWKKFK